MQTITQYIIKNAMNEVVETIDANEITFSDVQSIAMMYEKNTGIKHEIIEK